MSAGAQHGRLYTPIGFACGCPPEGREVTNLVCRNPDCIDYGTHRRGLGDDHCQWCGTPFTLLRDDPLRGAR